MKSDLKTERDVHFGAFLSVGHGGGIPINGTGFSARLIITLLSDPFFEFALGLLVVALAVGSAITNAGDPTLGHCLDADGTARLK